MLGNHLQDDLDTYFHKINKLMVCKGSRKKKLIEELKASIEDFLDDHPEASIHDIVGRFGTPEDIAIDYISSVEGSEFGNDLNSARFIKRAALFVGLAIVIIFCVLCIFCYLKNAESADGFTDFGVAEGIKLLKNGG